MLHSFYFLDFQNKIKIRFSDFFFSSRHFIARDFESVNAVNHRGSLAFWGFIANSEANARLIFLPSQPG